jgi:hypothetical protein
MVVLLLNLLLLSLLSSLESEIGVSGWLLDHCAENGVHAPRNLCRTSRKGDLQNNNRKRLSPKVDGCKCPALFFVKRERQLKLGSIGIGPWRLNSPTH